jgi:hypothetical protein
MCAQQDRQEWEANLNSAARDDLMVTSESQDDLDSFRLYLKRVYPETRTTSGTILDYVGMTFDFTTAGEVRVTMDKCIGDILSGCGVTTTKVTPAASVLFDVRDAPKATESVEWTRISPSGYATQVYKVLQAAL